MNPFSIRKKYTEIIKREQSDNSPENLGYFVLIPDALMVLSYLSGHDLVRCSRVCKLFAQKVRFLYLRELTRFVAEVSGDDLWRRTNTIPALLRLDTVLLLSYKHTLIGEHTPEDLMIDSIDFSHPDIPRESTVQKIRIIIKAMHRSFSGYGDGNYKKQWWPLTKMASDPVVKISAVKLQRFVMAMPDLMLYCAAMFKSQLFFRIAMICIKDTGYHIDIHHISSVVPPEDRPKFMADLIRVHRLFYA